MSPLSSMINQLVGMYIVFDSRPCFPDVGILRKVGFLIFEATKKYYPEEEKWLE